MVILGICGLVGSGKQTVIDFVQLAPLNLRVISLNSGTETEKPWSEILSLPLDLSANWVVGPITTA